MSDGYMAVLRLPGAPRLVAGLVAAWLSFGMVGITVLLVVHRATDSYSGAGLAVGAFTLGSGAVAPLRGRIIDGHGARVWLRAFALGYSACLLALGGLATAQRPAWILMAPAGGAGLSAPPLVAVTRGAWASITTDTSLRRAYALMSITGDVTFILAPGAAAFLFLWSPLAALGLCSACALAAAALIPAAIARRVRTEPPASDSQVAHGGSGLRVVLLVSLALGVSLGLVEVTVATAALAWHAPGLGGLLLGAFALGSVAGGLWFARRRWKGAAEERYLVGALLLGFAFLPSMFFASSPATLAVLLVLAGLAYGPVTISLFETLDRAVSVGATESLTWVTTAEALGGSLGSATAGVIVGRLGFGIPFGLACVVLAAPAAFALLKARANRSHAVRMP